MLFVNNPFKVPCVEFTNGYRCGETVAGVMERYEFIKKNLLKRETGELNPQSYIYTVRLLLEVSEKPDGSQYHGSCNKDQHNDE